MLCINGKFHYLLVKQAITVTDSIKLLQQLAAQLQQEGKTPSLALFRARLAGQISPPQLFSAYQHWRANPIVADLVMTNSVITEKNEHNTLHNSATTHLSEIWQNQQDILSRLERIEAKLDNVLRKLELI